MDYRTLNDESLMLLIAREQADALAELYDRYSRLVFSLARNAVGDQALAEEVTQEVFIQVWKNAHSYRAERAKVATWLSSITRYRAIDTWRRRNARPPLTSDAWVEAVEVADGLDLEGSVELRLQGERLREAIARLPEAQRLALSLAYFQGLTHQEIADGLGAPLGTVKTRIRLAMQKLRKMLSEPSPIQDEI